MILFISFTVTQSRFEGLYNTNVKFNLILKHFENHSRSKPFDNILSSPEKIFSASEISITYQVFDSILNSPRQKSLIIFRFSISRCFLILQCACSRILREILSISGSILAALLHWTQDVENVNTNKIESFYTFFLGNFEGSFIRLCCEQRDDEERETRSDHETATPL